jgi:hypothetical protein
VVFLRLHRRVPEDPVRPFKGDLGGIPMIPLKFIGIVRVMENEYDELTRYLNLCRIPLSGFKRSYRKL